MLEVKSKDWLINQKSLPDEDSDYFVEFWETQRKYCLEGVYVEGLFIPPELYWHLNFWKTMVDYKTIIGGKEVVRDKLMNPILRDNEFIIFNAIDRAQREHKGLAIGGSRRISKSTTMSSYLAYGATFDQNSQNVLVGTNSSDIKTMVNMIEVGLNNVEEPFRWTRIENDWSKQVTLGSIDKAGIKYPYSRIIIRNINKGNNEEAIAGLKPRRLVIDEAAKENFLNAYMAAVPAFTTAEGILACSPIVSFTGGDIEKFMDAKKLMFDVEAFDFLAYPDEDNPKRTHGLFLGNKYRQDGKVDSTLGDYLKSGADVNLHGVVYEGEPGEDLMSIPMKVSDEAKSDKVLNESLDRLLKLNDRKKYLKEKMYFPRKVDDIFLNTNVNMFNVEAANRQQKRIKENDFKGDYVELYQVENEIRVRHSSKTPITEYPLRHQDPDAPVVIWEYPVPDPPKFLYVAGVDPYRFDESAYSDSLGAVYIFKRMHSITGDGFQDMLVASYVARPESKDTWNEQARLLIKYYNAYALVENDELSFIEYMKSKKEAEIYLAPEPQIQKSLVMKSTLSRKFGVSRTSSKVRDFLNTLAKKYTEEVYKTVDKEDLTVEVTGMTKIYDYALLEEIKCYSEDANVDRLVAFSLCLCLSNELGPMVGYVGDTEVKEPTISIPTNRVSSLFGRATNPFNLKTKTRKPGESKWL